LRITAVVFAYLAYATLAHAQGHAESLFREGNSLFRSGIYETALIRYREAANAGLNSPTLYYNTGVTAYKVGQFEVAEAAFRRAQQDASFAALASYNLGLTYRKLGRPLEAEQSFLLAASSSSDRGLASLATRAAESVAIPFERIDRGERPSRFRHPASRPQVEAAGRLRLLMSARLGQDDNVYRSPSSPYVDFGAPGQPVVTPVVQAASFVPIDVLAEYTMQNEPRDTLFRFSYRLDGDFYESEFSNANRISQRFEIGADVADTDETGRRRRLLRSSFYIVGRDETNFDPDNGIDRDFNGVDISRRLAYKGAGIELNFEHALRRWSYGVDARFEGRQYDDVAPLPGYDHDLSFLRLGTAYSLTRKVTLEAGLLRYRRSYDERLARNLDGDFLTTNAILEYDYSGLELGISYAISPAIEVAADYLFLDRKDGFEGYFDSIQDRLLLSARYRLNDRVRLSASLRARALYYPNAFAFHDNADEFLDTIDRGAELRAEFRITPEISIWAQLMTDKVKSTDPRLAYERSRTMLGLLWRY
jgi:hypothetical protein